MPGDLDTFSQFTIKIYEPPLSLIRDRGEVQDLSNPIHVLLLVVDFHTEVTMEDRRNKRAFGRGFRFR